MKYIRQLGIIMSVTFLGELLHYFILLPVPASIYGLLLMLISLLTGIIRISQVKETANFLLDIMPILFVPSGVGLMDKWGVLSPVLVPVAVTVLVSTVIVMVASGHATQAVILLSKRKEAKRDAGISL